MTPPIFWNFTPELVKSGKTGEKKKTKLKNKHEVTVGIPPQVSTSSPVTWNLGGKEAKQVRINHNKVKGMVRHKGATLGINLVGNEEKLSA